MIIDLHNHTSRYSDCSIIGPDDLLQMYIRGGVDGICITEHNVIWPPDEQKKLLDKYGDRINIFFGMEVDTDAGHVLLFGDHEHVIPGQTNFAHLAGRIDREKTALIWAHPFRWKTLDKNKKIDSRIISSFDAIEVYNGNCTRRVIEFTKDYFSQYGINATGGSDTHAPSMALRFATEFSGPVTSTANLVSRLKSGAYQPVALSESSFF